MGRGPFPEAIAVLLLFPLALSSSLGEMGYFITLEGKGVEGIWHIPYSFPQEDCNVILFLDVNFQPLPAPPASVTVITGGGERHTIKKSGQYRIPLQTHEGNVTLVLRTSESCTSVTVNPDTSSLSCVRTPIVSFDWYPPPALFPGLEDKVHIFLENRGTETAYVSVYVPSTAHYHTVIPSMVAVLPGEKKHVGVTIYPAFPISSRLILPPRVVYRDYFGRVVLEGEGVGGTIPDYTSPFCFHTGDRVILTNPTSYPAKSTLVLVYENSVEEKPVLLEPWSQKKITFAKEPIGVLSCPSGRKDLCIPCPTQKEYLQTTPPQHFHILALFILVLVSLLFFRERIKNG